MVLICKIINILEWKRPLISNADKVGIVRTRFFFFFLREGLKQVNLKIAKEKLNQKSNLYNLQEIQT